MGAIGEVSTILSNLNLFSQDDELKRRIHLEKLKELEQTATTEELHCVRRRYHQQKSVVPARSRDEHVMVMG